MAKKKSAGRSENTLHVAFGIGSFFLVVTTLWVFYQDHFGREFPKYQHEYRQFELKRLQAERDKANGELREADFRKQEKAYNDAVAKYQHDVNEKKPEIDKLKNEAADYQNQLAAATIQLNAMKANYDELKSRIDRGVETDRTLLVTRDQEIARKATEQYELQTKKDAALAAVEKIEAPLNGSKRELDGLFATLNDLRTKMHLVAGTPVINAFLDAPLIDIVQPRNKIEQVLLPNLKFNVFFSDAPRVDRCVSCHQGIAEIDPAYANLGAATVSFENGEVKKTYKDRELKVLRSHPRLDLFVGAGSKHPYKKFGCTICHGGQPMGTKFNLAAHSPQDKEQESYWRVQYDWAPDENWDSKMLPLQYVEASCAKCHKGTDEVPEAAKLNEGRHIFRDRGCVNCHFGSSGSADMKWVGRVGPDLRRIGEKTNIDWARGWIENPWDFRPSTKMPRLFGLENQKDKAYQIEVAGKVHARGKIETEAIATYLFIASQLRETPPPPPATGDVEKGRKLYVSVGCVGCHSTHDAADKDKIELNQHGPDLSRIGDKLSAGWLFQWLKNPRHYWAETKMPNLRLNDDEAANLTSYLMSTMKTAAGVPRDLEAYPIEAFEKIIIEKLASSTPEEVVRERLKDPMLMVENQLKAKVKYASFLDEKTGISQRRATGDGEWSEAQIDKIKEVLGKQKDPARAAKVFYTGEALIQNYGCYGCHNIQGWTYAPLTCVNLTGEADKDLDKFDFGKAGHDHSIAETKWDWLFAKVARPRVFDRDKEELIKPYDRLRMPWFGFTGIDTDAVADAMKESKESKEGEEGESHASSFKKYAPENNPDKTSMQVLGRHEIQRLVTYLMSLTDEKVQNIPGEMQRTPTAKDLALDHGRRVIRELNCAGCHTISIGSAATHDGATTLPLAAFVALSTPKARAFLKTPASGIYSDENLVSLDYNSNDVQLKGFLNVQRGTYLNDATLPILFEETLVRTSPVLPWENLSFRFEKTAKGPNAKLYGELVTADEYIHLTELMYDVKYDKASMKQAWDKLADDDLDKIDGKFENLVAALRERYGYSHDEAVKSATERAKRDYSEAKSGYALLAKQYVDINAYQRLAGTKALKLPDLRNEELDGQRKFYQPIMVNVRLTRGEGRIMNHIIAVEKDLFKNDNASQQQAPPSLSFEGGKIQPDWLYQFLHNVKPLRVGLNVRMPSFWTDGPYSQFKSIYPAGRLSAVDPLKREKGVAGEPLPGPDAIKLADLPNDPQQIVDYFVTDAGQNQYGGQPVLMDEDQKKLYEMGKRYVTEAPPSSPEDKVHVGIGCINCHSVGNYVQPIPKWAPNLANVKRRLKEDWLRRFITFPPSLYPWTNMPNNFVNWTDYNHDLADPSRGIIKDEETKKQVSKMEAVRFFLMHSGDGELGTDIKPPAAAAAAPK